MEASSNLTENDNAAAETKTKYCAGHLPTCGVVVSDTGYGIDLLYKQDKIGSLITAVRSQE